MPPNRGALRNADAIEPVFLEWSANSRWRVGMRTACAFVLALVLAACSLQEPNSSSETISIEHLTQHWVHSAEEDQPNGAIHVYRPHDFKEFPASRFRMQYIFKPDGSCDWFYLAPNDGHHFRSGTWRLDPQETVLHVEQGEHTVSYRIVEMRKSLLRVAPING